MAVRHWLKRAWQRRLLRLPRRGEGTRISGRARIEEPQNVFLGRGCRIDEHAFLSAPGDTRIELGDRVEIRPYVFLETQGGGVFSRDGKSLIFTANEPGHGSRVFVIDLVGGKPRAVTPEGYRAFGRGVSPDATGLLVIGPDRRRYLYPLSGGEPAPIPGLSDEDTVSGWGADGHHLFLYRRRDVPGRLYRLDLSTGKKDLVSEVMPADGAGIVDVAPIFATQDGSAYVYGLQRTLSELYLVEGLK